MPSEVTSLGNKPVHVHAEICCGKEVIAGQESLVITKMLKKFFV
jgi:hypothetical protein